MRKATQAKHVPEDVILRVLGGSDRWMTHWDHPDRTWSIVAAAPELRAFPPKVLLAKLRSMASRGLIDGCACGCRGDWHLPG